MFDDKKVFQSEIKELHSLNSSFLAVEITN